MKSNITVFDSELFRPILKSTIDHYIRNNREADKPETPSELSNYCMYKVLNDTMNTGFISDTPQGAIVFGRRVESFTDSQTVDEKYGYIVITKDKKAFFGDIIRPDESLTIQYRNELHFYGSPNVLESEISEIYVVIMRMF